MVLLNLGCWNYKIDGFVNIDIDPSVNPDRVMDIREVAKHYAEGSVDYINASHVLEHLTYDEALQLVNDCYKMLKVGSSLVVTVPDYEVATKLCGYQQAESIIFAHGHKQIFNSQKLYDLFLKSSFVFFYKIDLNRVPFIVVSNILDPKPDPWQVSMLALKF